MYYFTFDDKGNILLASRRPPATGTANVIQLDESTESYSAFMNPSFYQVTSGKLTTTPAWSAAQLAQAKVTQSASIESAYAKLFGAGLTSSADGTSRVYMVDAKTIQDVGLAKTITQVEYPSSGIEAELLDGSYITLDYTQMQTFASDLQNFYIPVRSKRIKLLDGIKTATTVADVQAIAW